MTYLGIDLSLRSTGLVYISKDNSIKYKLITSDAKTLNDEPLLKKNAEMIMEFIKECNPDCVGLEGLSFGSISNSKDIIAGNFWNIRLELYKNAYYLEVIPVLTWRSKLFNKDERKELKENTAKLNQLKKYSKSLSKEDKKQVLLDNEELILRSNIKYLTWEKLPEPYKSEFRKIGFNKGCFDLTDAYFIAQHLKSNHK